MTVILELDDRQVRVELPEVARGAIECRVDGRTVSVDVCEVQPGVVSLLLGGRQFRCARDGDSVVVNGQRFPFAIIDPRSLRRGKGATHGTDGPRPVKATMPGRIVRLMVEAGEEVAAQQGLVVVEAMKMQNELRSPRAGRVARIVVAEGDTVQSGDVIMVIE